MTLSQYITGRVVKHQKRIIVPQFGTISSDMVPASFIRWNPARYDNKTTFVATQMQDCYIVEPKPDPIQATLELLVSTSPLEFV